LKSRQLDDQNICIIVWSKGVHIANVLLYRIFFKKLFVAIAMDLLGKAKGANAPLKVVLPPELYLNDKIDFNMIKVLPPLFSKNSICSPEFFFKKNAWPITTYCEHNAQKYVKCIYVCIV